MRTFLATITTVIILTLSACHNQQTEKRKEKSAFPEVYAREPNDSADYKHIKYDFYFSKTGKGEVFLKGDQLWFKSFRSPKLNGPMSFYKANTFAIKWEYQDMNCDAFALFGLDENGKAQSIKMKGISPNIDFSFDFQDLDFQRIK
jgi:hypothetical protein